MALKSTIISMYTCERNVTFECLVWILIFLPVVLKTTMCHEQLYNIIEK